MIKNLYTIYNDRKTLDGKKIEQDKTKILKLKNLHNLSENNFVFKNKDKLRLLVLDVIILY